MCGIAGIFKWYEPLTFEDLTAVQRMLEAQVHRGPDSEGIFIAGAGSQEFAGRIPQAFSLLPPASSSSVVLGHRRLAIIDLSQAGRQPIANEDGAIWVTYNGEIYNFPELREELITQGHVFRSRTDSEVLVHGYEEWGIDKLLSRLRGMFAFALYDASFRGSTGTNDSGSARLILARDRFGIKPLYYCLLSNGGIAFASEVKALRRSGVVSHERDAEALTGFLLFGSVPSPLTILKDVRCLLPGHYLVAQNGDTTLHRHWNLPTFHACQNGENRGTADLHSILKDAVTRHLVSEVPLGIFLSGGIDSAGLVALTSRATHSACKTLTMSFVEKAWSEAQQARQIAEHFSTEYAEVLVRGDDFIRELPEILTAMDQPTTDGVNTYFVAKAARQAGLTVILSGLGGDEVFWGYRHYRWLAQRYLQLLTQLPSVLRNALVSCLSAYGRLRGQERWKRFTYLKGPFSEAGFYLVVRGFFAPDQVEQLLGFDSSTPEATVEKALRCSPFLTILTGQMRSIFTLLRYNAICTINSYAIRILSAWPTRLRCECRTSTIWLLRQ
jgi:asparagine synthase (glutamine-hydrolysing)